MKILIIDDEPDIREIISIAFNLRWPDATVLMAGNGKQGLETANAEKPDLVILDVTLPDIEGFDVCKQIRANTDVPVMFLTARDSELDKVRGLEAGADDYIIKPFNHLELLARVRAILRRHRSQSPGGPESQYTKGKLQIDFGARTVTVDGNVVDLPPLEYSLLYHLVKNANRVIPHKTLLAKVWGREYVDQVDYLKVHIQHLRSKIEDDAHQPRMIVTERGVGYRFVEPE
ncbi:MAG: response regulator transcription factor [Chloroflexi bacterium]|nr:response regulator transcription factor [Chloroflexota bacterium]